MLRNVLTRRNYRCLALALICAVIGYGAAIWHTQRTAGINAVAELWYLQEVLLNLENGDSQAARAAIALKADQALETIAEGKYPLLGAEQREFRSKVLNRYREFRETHRELYELFFPIPPESKDELIRRDRALSNFLKNHE